MSEGKKSRHLRRRLLARLLALNFLLFSSPFLTGWFAFASEQSGTRLVELCTVKGLRLVAVPVEDLPVAPVPDDEQRRGFDCARCPLGKCSGSGFVPALLTGFVTTPADVESGAGRPSPLLTATRVIHGPPARAPPAVA